MYHTDAPHFNNVVSIFLKWGVSSKLTFRQVKAILFDVKTSRPLFQSKETIDMTRGEFLRSTVFGGMFAACPALARTADAAAGVKPPGKKAKTPGMEALSEIYRIGHGPSSSHTMGPYRASELFLERNKGAARFEATLYGSLSATGKGHFTDKAITDVLGEARTKIIWSGEGKPFHPNGMELRAYGADGRCLEKWLCYSVGGGALAEEGKISSVPKVYKEDTMEKIIAWCDRKKLPIWGLFDEVEGEAGWKHLAEVRRTMSSTLYGISGTYSLGEGMGSWICLIAMATVVSPLKGTRPVSISKSVIPSEYISLFSSEKPPLTCSGDV